MASITALTADDESVILGKLKHAFTTYDSAIKKYLTAVKELDSTLELLAVSVRELSQSESDVGVKSLCDTFCNRIDKHKSAVGAVSGGGQDKKHKKNSTAAALMTIDTASIAPQEYYFSVYMSDFNQKVSTELEKLKMKVGEVEKSRKHRDEKLASYQKHKKAVDSLESKLAKKNKAVNEDPHYKKELDKRDQAKNVAETEHAAFQEEYKQVLLMRTEVLRAMVQGLSTTSAQYYRGVSQTLNLQE